MKSLSFSNNPVATPFVAIAGIQANTNNFYVAHLFGAS